MLGQGEEVVVDPRVLVVVCDGREPGAYTRPLFGST
jgi:hypothetical protein